MEEIDLFPLNTVLFPDGVIHLKVFEVRYLDMVKRCLAESKPFGIVALSQGNEVHRPGVHESLMSVGTLAFIKDHEAIASGVVRIEAIGGQRFTIKEARQGKYDQWKATVQRLAPDPVIAIPEELASISTSLKSLIERFQAESIQSAPFPFAEPYHFEDSGWVANRWCELLPIETTVKQQLMSLDNPLLRLELAGDMLTQYQVTD